MRSNVVSDAKGTIEVSLTFEPDIAISSDEAATSDEQVHPQVGNAEAEVASDMLLAAKHEVDLKEKKVILSKLGKVASVLGAIKTVSEALGDVSLSFGVHI